MFRAMSPWKALIWASIAEFVGPILLGTAVAENDVFQCP